MFSGWRRPYNQLPGDSSDSPARLQWHSWSSIFASVLRKAWRFAVSAATRGWSRNRRLAYFRRWGWRFLLVFITVTAFTDYVIPIIGSIYIPPRSARPSKLPYGLSPVDTLPRHHPAAVDIVFVHGLGSFPDSTWQKPAPGKTAPGVSWIRDFLPADIPQARLLFFNYDSTTYNDAPKKNLADIADELLFAFEASELRSAAEEQKRPIIFVCHSYGGLVFKEALYIATTARTGKQTDISPYVYGIVFLGTPHRGTKYSGYAHLLASRLNRLGSNPDIFLPLEIDSPQLLDLHSSFMGYFSHLKMLNFYETKSLVIFKPAFWGVPIAAMIVEKGSATFEAKSTENHALDYDHSGLNKFGSREDQGYAKIKFALRRMIEDINAERRRILDEEEGRSNSNWKIPVPGNNTRSCATSQRYLVPPQTVSPFIERPALMYLLEKYMKEEDQTKLPPHSVALWGRGGVGKSQLALRFVELHRHEYDPIIWVDAETPASIMRSYSRAFDALNLEYPSHILDEERKHGHGRDDALKTLQHDWVLRAVFAWLESRTDADCPWLVVINDADNIVWIPEAIPRGSRGSVILTSRDDLVSRLANHFVSVGDMETGEAIDLLLHGVGAPKVKLGNYSENAPGPVLQKPHWRIAQEQQAFAIIEKLGHLALPIAMANSYILQHDHVLENLSVYLDYVTTGSYAVLDSGHGQIGDAYRFSLASVFETSFLSISEISGISTTLLSLLAQLNHASLDDRLFREATEARYFFIFLATDLGIRFLIAAKTIACILGPLWGSQLVLLALGHLFPAPFIRNDGRSKRYTAAVMTYMPLGLTIIFMVIGIVDEKTRIEDGEIVTRPGELHPKFIIWAVFLGCGYATPHWADWLLGDEECAVWSSNTWPTLFTTTVMMWWGFEWLMFGLDKEVEAHTMHLLQRLDFSKTNLFQFEQMLAELNRQTRESIGLNYAASLGWIIVWNVILKLILVLVIFSITLLWTRFVERVIIRHRSENNGFWAKLGLAMLKLSTRPAAASFFANLVAFWVYYFFGYFGVTEWIPWERTVNEVILNPATLNGFLTKWTLGGGWNPIPYSEAASPLTRFGLLQRSHNELDGTYIMHPLVQWWAVGRLDKEDGQAYVYEAFRFLSLVYSSDTCFSDITCQQMLIPHLLSVATSDVLRDGTHYWRMKQLLKMLYRSLVKVGRI